MTNGRIARALRWCCLGCCSGCAVFQSPQVIPEEWKHIDGVDHMDAASLKAMQRQPRDLDESIERTHKLLRQFARAGAQADNVPQAAGTALTALGAYGGYRGVVRPSAHTAAALLGVGGAIYGAGSGVKWSERSAAYTTAAQGMRCLLEAARPYQIRGHAEGRSGQQRLDAARLPVQEALLALELALAAHAQANEEYLTSAARTIAPACPANTWAAPECAPVTGADSTRYERDCRKTQERYQRMCAPRRKPAEYSVAAPEVSAAFAGARSAAAHARSTLNESGRMQVAANDAGTQLWTGSLDVILRAFTAVRNTGADLPELLRQLRAALQEAKPQDVTGRGQGRTPSPEKTREPDADRKRIARQTDGGARAALYALDEATRRVTTVMAPLQDVLDNNGSKPDFSAAPFQACVSNEASVVQTAVRVAAAPPVSTLSAGNELVELTPELRARLRLGADALPSEIDTRIRRCQRSLGIAETGTPTRILADLLRNRDCEVSP